MNPPELPGDGKPPPELPANGKTPPSSPRKELQLQGPHPTALKVSQESHKIKKPPLSPSSAAVHHQPAPPETAQQQRRPVVRYEDLRPRTIRVRTEKDFKDLVQRLTGLPPGEVPHAGTGNVPPPARVTSIEKNERVVQNKGKSVEVGQSHANTQVPISPAPATRPPIAMMPPPPFSNHFRPPNTFLPRPTGLFARMLSPARAILPPIAPGSSFPPNSEPLSFNEFVFRRIQNRESGSLPGPLPPIAPESSSLSEFLKELNELSAAPSGSLTEFGLELAEMMASPSDLPPGILSPVPVTQTQQNPSCSAPSTLTPATATMPPIAPASSPLSDYYLEVDEFLAIPSDLPPGIVSPAPVTQTQQSPSCSLPGILPPATATMPPISPVSSPFSDYYLQVDDFLAIPSDLPPGIMSPVPVTPTQPSSSGLVSDSMDPPQPSPDQFNPFI